MSGWGGVVEVEVGSRRGLRMRAYMRRGRSWRVGALSNVTSATGCVCVVGGGECC